MKINTATRCFDMVMYKVCGVLTVFLLELKLELNSISKDLYFLQFFLRFPEGKRIEDCKPKKERVFNPLIKLLL